MSNRRGVQPLSPHWWIRYVILLVGLAFIGFGGYLTFFFVTDIGFVLHSAIQAGGTITVGDRMDVLQWELYVGIPVALTFIFMGFIVLSAFYINWWRTST